MIGTQQIKDIIGSIGMSRFLRPLIRTALKSRCNIVYYHHVGKSEPYYQEFTGNCSIDRFDQDLHLLKTYFDIVPLARVLDLARSQLRAPDPLLAVTFDDGFDLIRNGGMDVLNHHGVRAAMFVITSCVDNKNLMWRNKLSAILHSTNLQKLPQAFNAMAPQWNQPLAREPRDILRSSLHWPMASKEERVDYLWDACGMPPLATYLDEYRPYMTWSDLEVWRSHGHDVGLHSHSHPICARLDEAQVRDEIVEPAAALKKRFGLDAVPFAYPFGIRLPRETEDALCRDKTIQCALGIRGSSPMGTPLSQLERAPAEAGLAFPLFGKCLIEATLPFARSGYIVSAATDPTLGFVLAP